MSNAEFAKSNELFEYACEAAGIMPTKRQASKFRSRSGLAHRFINEAKRQLASDNDAEARKESAS